MDKFDTTEISNPKKRLARQEEEAMGGKKPTSAAPAPKGGMSQAEFSGYKGMTAEEKAAKAKKLAEVLRNR